MAIYTLYHHHLAIIHPAPTCEPDGPRPAAARAFARHRPYRRPFTCSSARWRKGSPARASAPAGRPARAPVLPILPRPPHPSGRDREIIRSYRPIPLTLDQRSKYRMNAERKSADFMHEIGTLPTSARGAGNCFAGAEGVVSTAGHESEAEQGAEAARVPRTIREFIKAVFHFCRVL